MKFSICTDIMYDGLSFDEKLVKIKVSGFDTIEFWSRSNKDLKLLKKMVKDGKIGVSCFCIDPIDEKTADTLRRYTLNSGLKEDLRLASVESIKAAKDLGASALIITVGDSIDGIPYEDQIKTVKETINYIKDLFEDNKVTLLIEPINLKERGKYLTPNVKSVAEIVKEINSEYVKVLYDIYHQAMEEDFDVSEMIALLPHIGHIHIADVPGRGEPGSGKIDWKSVFDALNKNGYKGFAGVEFKPQTDEKNALHIVKEFCK